MKVQQHIGKLIATLDFKWTFFGPEERPIAIGQAYSHLKGVTKESNKTQWLLSSIVY